MGLRKCVAYSVVPSVVVIWGLLQVFWLAQSNTNSSLPLFTTTLSSAEGSQSPSSLPPANSTSILGNLTARLLYSTEHSHAGGLWLDVVIYRELLEGLGYAVEIFNMYEHPTPASAGAGVASFQVLFKRLRHPWLVAGRYNMLVVNQDIGHEMLYHMLDAVVCKSMMAKELVERYIRNYSQEHAPLDLEVFHIGHTSVNSREKLAGLPAIPQDFTQFIHVGGKSLNKGTDVVYNTWRIHPEWPRLHLVDFMHTSRYFRPEHVCADCPYNSWPNKTGVMIQENLILYAQQLTYEELLRLQQSSGVHLCPSREEGFGHYINKARALGALVMTTDWEPMSDLVQDHFGVLISCQPTSTSFYQSSLPGNQACVVGPTDLEKAMDKYFGLITKEKTKNETDDQFSLDKVRSMGKLARAQFEHDRDDFHDRMRNLFGKVLPQAMLTHHNAHNDDVKAP